MHLEGCEVSVIETEASEPALKLPLREFLECSSASHSVKIVKGSNPDFDLQQAFDIPCDTSLVFHRRVSSEVYLEYLETLTEATDCTWSKISLPVDCVARFRLLPYDPKSGETSVDHIYHTVHDLVQAFPVYTQANATHGDKFTDPKSSFNCGDRLKLIRLVVRNSVKFVECKLLGEPQLLQLPMTCVGDFTALPDDTTYLVGDIVSLPPRRRRVCLTDSSQKVSQISGLPENYQGDLYITAPVSVIEASPVDNHSLIIGLPADLDMMVALDKPAAMEGEMLSTFATNNRSILPAVACVSDWEEETTILENHYIKPGVEIVVHGWTRQSKVLAISGDSHYAIPLTYTGKFRIKPKQYLGVSELERAYPGNKLRVTKVDKNDNSFPLLLGDIIRIKREDTLKRRTFAEVEIRCERYEAGGRLREFKLPLTSMAVFEEHLEDAGHSYTIKELVSIVSDQEVMVEVAETSHDYKSLGSTLPSGQGILLCDFVIEPAVYVSVESPEAPAFHIPLRTRLRVQLLYQLDRTASPLLTRNNPRLSTLDRCVEVLSSHIFQSLRPQRALGAGTLPDRTQAPPRRAAGPSPTHAVNNRAGSRVSNGWSSSIIGDRDILSGKFHVRKSHKPPSVAGSDIAGGTSTKTNGVKVKSKFRRHKSQENLVAGGSHNSSTGAVALSLPSQDIEYTQSVTNANVILAERGVSTLHTPQNISTDSQQLTAGVPVHTVNIVSERPLSPETRAESGSVQTTASANRDHQSAAKSQHQRSLQGDPKDKVKQPVVINTERQTVKSKQSNPNKLEDSQRNPKQASNNNNVHTMHVTTGESELTSTSSGIESKSQNSPVRARDPAMVGLGGEAQAGSRTKGHSPATAASPTPGRQNGHPPHLNGVAPHTNHTGANGPTANNVLDIPPGYALVAMPTTGQPAEVTAGYMLVPVTSPGHHTSDVPSEAGDGGFHGEPGILDMSFSKTKCPVTLPPDGNLYRFSVKKFGEFLGLLRLDEAVIQYCVKQKIDGKKFSRLGNSDLQKLGILHPVVLYFRRLTGKTKNKFML